MLIALLVTACSESRDAGGEPDAGPTCGSLGQACTATLDCDEGMQCVIVGEQGFCARSDARRECVADDDCDADELCETGRGIVSDGHCITRTDLACLCAMPDAASTLARCADL
ncbi:hypothetical protein DB32_008259 [Sandaracinus amylolyticus]|uniref:Uncharacterized protein n=1 Tax=Sandaracinus amylolyticus TaxID=927083 RepID=A0A0F6YM82_9BACT|nr:hypothetical protein DB32_008259 [Sandaracinus amylolyticus]